MNKVKLLLVVLAIAALGMGAAYAAWAENITIAGTAQTGNVDVNIRWANLSAPDYVERTISTISPDRKSVSFKVSDLYPTAYLSSNSKTFARLHFSVENNGSIPVVLDSVEFVPDNPNAEVWNWLRTVVHIHAGTPSSTGTSLSNSRSLTGVNPLAGDLKDIDKLLLGTHPTDKTSTLPSFVLMPGQAIWFGGTDMDDEEQNSIRFFLSQNAPNSTQNEEIGFTLKFNWKQFNK